MSTAVATANALSDIGHTLFVHLAKTMTKFTAGFAKRRKTTADTDPDAGVWTHGVRGL